MVQSKKEHGRRAKTLRCNRGSSGTRGEFLWRKTLTRSDVMAREAKFNLQASSEVPDRGQPPENVTLTISRASDSVGQGRLQFSRRASLTNGARSKARGATKQAAAEYNGILVVQGGKLFVVQRGKLLCKEGNSCGAKGETLVA